MSTQSSPLHLPSRICTRAISAWLSSHPGSTWNVEANECMLSMMRQTDTVAAAAGRLIIVASVDRSSTVGRVGDYVPGESCEKYLGRKFSVFTYTLVGEQAGRTPGLSVNARQVILNAMDPMSTITSGTLDVVELTCHERVQ